MKNAILLRRSVRTYEKKVLSLEDEALVNEITNEINSLKGPFGNSSSFTFLNQPTFLDDEAKKIGTYGFVKNPPAFLIGKTTNDRNHIIDYGYLFEDAVIKLTNLDLGTVWLAGTFHRSAFNHMVKENEVIPAITPVGYAEEKLSLREKMIRMTTKADRRKSFAEMFYIYDFNTPLTEEIIDQTYLIDALTFVQRAPSASNKQPWRILMDQNIVHVYLERTPNYGLSLPFTIQYLDMGIAIYHFEAALKEHHIDYEIKEEKHLNHEKLEYIISFIMK